MRISDEERELRGNRAALLLENETFDEVLDDLTMTLHSALDSMPADDTEAVMSIVRQLRAVKAIRGKAQAWASEARTIKTQREGSHE